MLEKLKNFIVKEGLFEANQKILLAVSGGIDSVVMAHLFKSLNYNFGIAHCNFKLRGEASDIDELFVKQLAFDLNVPFHSASFETEKMASEQKLSIQVAARQLRYDWFNKTLQNNDYQLIATAHHLNDSIETVLYNFTKGCGIRGLHGIPSKNKNIIRPLLFATRQDLEIYAKTHGINYREDSSNVSDKYMRNKIRHHVIPVLRLVNPSFEVTAKKTIDNLKETEAVFNWAIEQVRKNVTEFRDDLVYIKFKKIPEEGKATLLFELLNPYGFNTDQCHQILFDEHAQSGAIFHSDSHRLIIDRNYYIIEQLKEKDAKEFLIQENLTELKIDDNSLKINILESISNNFSKEKNIAELDFDRLNFPLKLRKWKPGDKFQPLGMAGKKQKLQDFFTHQKLSIPEKEKTWILESDDKICWVVGHRIDERFKITDQTKRSYRLEVKTR